MIDWFIGMLLVSRSGLVEDNVFHPMVFNCPLLSLCKTSSPFRENNNVVFQFPFHVFLPLAKLCFIHLQGHFPILRSISCPVLYPIIRLLIRPLEQCSILGNCFCWCCLQGVTARTFLLKIFV